MLEALQFMPVKERIQYNVRILIHKIVNGDCPSYLKNEIEQVRREEGVQARSEGSIHIKRCKTREEQRILLYDGFKMYNNLSNEIRKEKKFFNFKKVLVPYMRSGEG